MSYLKKIFFNLDKCFVFGPGMTIHGGDYRRDYNIKKQDCAETCKYDVCCKCFFFKFFNLF